MVSPRKQDTGSSDAPTDASEQQTTEQKQDNEIRKHGDRINRGILAIMRRVYVDGSGVSPDEAKTLIGPFVDDDDAPDLTGAAGTSTDASDTSDRTGVDSPEARTARR